MVFEKLLSEKKIEKVEVREYSDSPAIKDIKTAENVLNSGDYDWSVAISYNAILRVVREYMQSLGFRSIGREHHKNCFEFMRETGFDEELIEYFDNIRTVRNSFVYRDISAETKEGAKETILKAKDFVQKMRTFVQKMRTGGRK